MNALFSLCCWIIAGGIVAALLASPLYAADLSAEKKFTCPADHHSVGQKPPTGHEWKCVDSDGNADGLWLTWYDNGQLMSESQMKHGKEHGRQRSWWPNGQLMMEGISYDGNRYKGFKYWSINGEPTELNIQTETVRKKVDDTGKPAPIDTPMPSPKSAPPAK